MNIHEVTPKQLNYLVARCEGKSPEPSDFAEAREAFRRSGWSEDLP